MTRAIAAILACALTGGCGGGPSYVPVSGVVTLDAQPYKNAVVSFQPIGDEKNPTPGIGSSAVTDDQGKFTLLTADGKSGAAVGKHRVRIQSKREGSAVAIDPSVGSPDADPNAGKKGMIDPIPVEWYGDVGKKEFVVPASGTDKANFNITSAPRAKK